MSTLAEFLLARIAEDEQVASRGMTVLLVQGDTTAVSYAQRFGSDRALAEAEAKRKIVEWHHGTIDGWCSGCGYELPSPCPNLRLLAAIYADHPDYREEWKP